MNTLQDYKNWRNKLLAEQAEIYSQINQIADPKERRREKSRYEMISAVTAQMIREINGSDKEFRSG